MKKISLLLSFSLLAAVFTQAQNDALNNFFEQHKRDKAFTFAYLSKDLVEVVTESKIADPDWKKLHQVVKNIGSLSVLATDDNNDARSLYKEARELIPNDEFDELITVRDGQDNVRVWTKDEDNTVTDLILLVGTPDEFVLVCFTGKLELGNISELAKLLDAEGAEQLAKATELVAIDFKISPNPSDGSFTLTYSDKNDVPAQLSVTDQNGRQISTLNLSGSTSQQVVLQDIPSGLYWVQMKTKEGKVGVKQVQIMRK